MDNYIKKNLGKKKDPKLSAKQVMELTALIGKWLAYSEIPSYKNRSPKNFIEEMVSSDLSRFVDQYFYTLKKYSFKKDKTKIRIKGMEWHRLIREVEQQIKLDEGIGDSKKRVNSFYNGKTIDGKVNPEIKELHE
tara:strand:+ start:59 stop:463 length:405 start_codon:yes stop_codon:yes gene_type:complete